jgi:serine/threonine-protein kinase HipA
MSPELVAILDGRETGRVLQDDRGRLSFTYNETWRAAADAYPLSISMPLALAQHRNPKIDPFLWGLLPDNEMILDHWRASSTFRPETPLRSSPASTV